MSLSEQTTQAHQYSNRPLYTMTQRQEKIPPTKICTSTGGDPDQSPKNNDHPTRPLQLDCIRTNLPPVIDVIQHLPSSSPPSQPHIGFCRTNSLVPVISYSSTQPQLQKVSLVAASMPKQAYNIVTTNNNETEPQRGHENHPWCEELVGIRIPRLMDESGNNGPFVFTEPLSGIAEPVTIRRIHKAELHQCRAQGMAYNPYNDLLHMQTIGNGSNTLECIEALQDDNFLYIITPYVKDKLSHWISTGKAVSEDQARVIFTQLFESLRYLQGLGICHANLTPDNLVVGQNGRVILTGFDQSFRMQYSEESLVTNTTRMSGTAEYVPPEVHMGLPYNGYALDLWSLVVILFRLVTGGGRLYHTPTDEDPLFRYFLLARGISATLESDELSAEAFAAIDDTQQQSDLCELVEKYRLLSPELIDIFEGVLRVPLSTRWKLDDVLSCPWMQQQQDKHSDNHDPDL